MEGAPQCWRCEGRVRYVHNWSAKKWTAELCPICHSLSEFEMQDPNHLWWATGYKASLAGDRSERNLTPIIGHREWDRGWHEATVETMKRAEGDDPARLP